MNLMASPVEGSALTNLNSDPQYLLQLVEEFGQTLWFPLTVINCQFSDALCIGLLLFIVC